MSSIQPIKKVVYVNDKFDRENNFQEINANFSIPVIVETRLFDRQLTPTMSIAPTYLERVGRNKSRLTTLAQLPARRTFKKFGHEGGVELLVLSGVFSDADGDYDTGTYVRHPAKTYHEPFTRDGCTVLFKLGQFQPLDRKRVVVDTKDSAAKWAYAGEPGVSRLELHYFAEETVNLYRILSECWITFKNKNQGVEMFVCEGSITVDGNRYDTGTWLRYPIGSKIKVCTKAGATLYVKKSVFPA